MFERLPVKVNNQWKDSDVTFKICYRVSLFQRGMYRTGGQNKLVHTDQNLELNMFVFPLNRNRLSIEWIYLRKKCDWLPKHSNQEYSLNVINL